MNAHPKLRVGLLLCDDVDPHAQAQYGTYAAMFRRRIGGADAGLQLHPMRCDLGELPNAPGDFDAYLISGSRHAVYDAHAWIARLQCFVRDCRARRKKTVGICFGHQLIAHACGGEARKAEAGWGLGVHRSRITAPQSWMLPGAGDSPDFPDFPDFPDYRLVAIHQDQVTKLPPNFRVIAAGDFCPVSMLVDDGVMLGVQGHPEFSRAFCEFRIHARRAQLEAGVYRRALESLKLQPDAARVCEWIARFIRGGDAPVATVESAAPAGDE
ncbi:MAG: GMP synthase [Gammaproteobacteria bacterium]|nr:GMP synthase [Gammaproteobacteria bacterium]